MKPPPHYAWVIPPEGLDSSNALIKLDISVRSRKKGRLFQRTSAKWNDTMPKFVKRINELTWKAEKDMITSIQGIKKNWKIKVRSDIDERRGDLEKVSEIRCGSIPQLEKERLLQEQKLKTIQGQRGLLRMPVEEDIARVGHVGQVSPSNGCWNQRRRNSPPLKPSSING